ncbi:penicillin-binding protein 2 [Sphaerisporangium album]|uniref:Penicillin-binding protein 2 n=1 Tax=Sphaerisporangium album TaxID=509200 RepID=A0A367FFI3_9ACTN|nr:penicillin-binding protein 2 [Sphaerisporangium album]RCG29051.1 penicillin-binding protein 2 [Sphaerisporangium album]
MNGTLKRASVACLLMFGLLMININYLQAVKADELRTDARNQRTFYARYQNERGMITAGGQTLAKSVDVGGTFRFQRKYTKGEVYAPVIGFFAPESAQGIEGAENKYLDGTHPDLFVRRTVDLITSKPTRGAAVDLTLVPQAQEVAYRALEKSGKRGAVVAIEPKTGAILTLVSVPSYDPNTMAAPDKSKAARVYDKLVADPNKPLINRAIQDTYAPGSTFKVITSAAYLSEDESRDVNTTVDAPDVLPLPGTTIGLRNYHGESCGGRATLLDALTISCNTAFGTMALEMGYDKLNEQAAKFGIGTQLAIPLSVTKSDIGPDVDKPALAQTAIGQRSNQMTPLQMAMVAAGVANQGKVMKPYLVNKIVSPDGDEIDSARQEELSEAVSPDVADKLRQMMVSVVQNGTGKAAQLPGITVAGKTGTAETAKGQASHAWFIAFAPAEDPKVAVAVFVESGSAGNDATGGAVAAPIAHDVMQAVLDK